MLKKLVLSAIVGLCMFLGAAPNVARAEFITNETAGDLPCRDENGNPFWFTLHTTRRFGPPVRFSWLSDVSGWHSVILQPNTNYTLRANLTPSGWDAYLDPWAPPQ